MFWLIKWAYPASCCNSLTSRNNPNCLLQAVCGSAFLQPQTVSKQSVARHTVRHRLNARETQFVELWTLLDFGICWTLEFVGLWNLLDFVGFWNLLDFVGLWNLLDFVGFWNLLDFGLCWILEFVGLWTLLDFGICWTLEFVGLCWTLEFTLRCSICWTLRCSICWTLNFEMFNLLNFELWDVQFVELWTLRCSICWTLAPQNPANFGKALQIPRVTMKLEHTKSAESLIRGCSVAQRG